ncbi:hypothetical protein KAF25_009132 [Fusarium avenaceum]|uniref:Transcription factor domain-containing protein n=1 Tax=Fusarium avenaceum TaxID=40199 RepID=A0A9P7KME8_9HYPO|nr:hypothetical protein KAF25_009132 [Fusarium avenaceum]
MDSAYSLVLGLLPNCSSFPHLPSKPAIIKDIEASLWVPFTDDAINYYYSIYYHFAILLLFQHFVTLPIIGSEISPRDICLQATNAIQGFLTTYSQLYTLKWAPSFMPYFALASSLMHLALMAQTAQINNLDTLARTNSHLSEAVNQGIARLIEMKPYHQVAEQGLQLIYYITKKWNINLNIEIGAALDPEAYERLVRSFSGIIHFLSSTMVTQDSFPDFVTG